MREAETGVLFSGDAIYDGDLVDSLPHSDPTVHAETMARLRKMAPRTVHAGHFASFGRDKMVEIIDEYLAGGRRFADIATYT